MFISARAIRDEAGRLQGIVVASVEAARLSDVGSLAPAQRQGVDLLDERDIWICVLRQ